jgi:hypothetical protein
MTKDKCSICNKNDATNLYLHKGEWIDICWTCAIPLLEQRTWEEE